ncbi:acyl-CoA Delta-9 desaturase-like isoform X2 [Lycorma delicatula]
MAPNVTGSPASLFLAETEVISTKTVPSPVSTVSVDRPKYHWKIVWRNVIAFVYLHLGCLYGIYLLITTAKLLTFLWTILVASAGAIGVTAGSHRLWAHKAYRAHWPLRVILAIFQTLAFQNHIYEWVRDHRVHHKFTDTDADPHNSNRGFFFSHIGWLMIRKHKDVLIKGKTVDMSDLEKDWVVMLQKQLYMVIMPLFCFAIPTYIPIYFWNENPWIAWYVAGITRYTLSLNFTWLVNSAAHIWGTKPYDKNINPTENMSVAILTFGEGWHNYHHAFPWDYKAAELGSYSKNFTTAFIDFFAKIGWAYDMKTATPDMIKRRVLRTGDGSHPKFHHHNDEVWGWGDKDMKPEEQAMVEIINKKED